MGEVGLEPTSLATPDPKSGEFANFSTCPWSFYYQIKISFTGSNKFVRDVGFSLPFLFLVIMLADSYLLGHFTSLLFVFFSSFLYKDFEKS